MKPSIKQVARLADVSVATVSHVLNKTKKVMPETEKRVLDAIKLLDYRVNPIARNLRSGKSKMIGFVVSDLSNPHFIAVYQGLEQVLHAYGYKILIEDSKEDKQVEIENVKNLLFHAVDGLIIAPVTGDCSYLRNLIPHGFPVAFVDRRPEYFQGDTVLSANLDGAYQATSYLISKGHHRIGFIGSKFDSTMNERLEGYKKALSDAGIRFDNRYTLFGDGRPLDSENLKKGKSYENMKFLYEGTDITAVFTANNLASVGAFLFLKERGVIVPDKMAFITFDDSFWLVTASPAISAVTQYPNYIGQKLADMMIRYRLFNGDEKDQPAFRTERIGTKLIIRGSV